MIHCRMGLIYFAVNQLKVQRYDVWKHDNITKNFFKSDGTYQDFCEQNRKIIFIPFYK